MTVDLIDDHDLICHLKEVHREADTTNFNILDFVSAFGSPLDALVYSKLFWPDFIEYEGMIFMASILESADDRARVLEALSKGLSKSETEESFNNFDIPSAVFASHRAQITVSGYATLAERLAEMWRARLAQLFPDRVFDVTVIHPEDEQPNITICQSRP
jgi:hypothetical protein